LIQSYALNEFAYDYRPTILDNFKCGEISRKSQNEKETYQVFLMDVSTAEKYSRMRNSIYKSVDAIIFCFSLSNFEVKNDKSAMKTKNTLTSSSTISLNNIKTTWLPEVERALGQSKDKQDDEGFKFSSPADAHDSAGQKPSSDDSENFPRLRRTSGALSNKHRELPIKILVGTKSD
jgi:hypothetical protein